MSNLFLGLFFLIQVSLTPPSNMREMWLVMEMSLSLYFLTDTMFPWGATVASEQIILSKPKGVVLVMLSLVLANADKGNIHNKSVSLTQDVNVGCSVLSKE